VFLRNRQLRSRCRLVGVGVATLRATQRRSEIAFAAIPLVFGLQQVVEGALWL